MKPLPSLQFFVNPFRVYADVLNPSMDATVKTGFLIPLVTIILNTSKLTNIPVFTVGFKLFTDFTVRPVTDLHRFTPVIVCDR